MTTIPPEGTPTADQLAKLARHVGDGGSQHTEALTDVWTEAAALVDKYVGTARDAVPGPIWERAIIETASELYHRRNAPGGVLAQFSELGGSTVRLARDPMLGAYPLLDRWLPGGFA